MDGAAISHRQIELQSPEDLCFLIANVRRAATQHLEQAFPQSGEEDEMRSQIEALVESYISRTFASAAPNITINGLTIDSISPYLNAGADADRPAAEAAAAAAPFEPFDARKRQRVIDLTAEEEDLLRDIAALKRKAPREAAARFGERCREGLREDEEAARGAVERAEGEARVRGVLGLRGLERQGEVEARFREGVDALGRLKMDMPSVVARMERARVAGEYVVTGGR